MLTISERDRLAWFLFLRMDSVPVGSLTPQKLAEFLREFDGTSYVDMEILLREEFCVVDGEEDLPPSMQKTVKEK